MNATQLSSNLDPLELTNFNIDAIFGKTQLFLPDSSALHQTIYDHNLLLEFEAHNKPIPVYIATDQSPEKLTGQVDLILLVSCQEKSHIIKSCKCLTHCTTVRQFFMQVLSNILSSLGKFNKADIISHPALMLKEKQINYLK